MAKPKLIILAHGIGDADEDFVDDWKDVIAENHDLSGITVKGFCWEDSLQKAADKYDFGSGPLGEILDMCGFKEISKASSNNQWKVIKDYMMDVLVYVGLDEMWQKIQLECAAKLAAMLQDEEGAPQFKEAETILIGHSLGAAMWPQLVWREYASTGAIAYHGLILLASPIGFESPDRKISADFLMRMGEVYGGDRLNVLRRFARAWRRNGKNRLRFIINENDIVCSDVHFPLGSKLVDLIPLRQGFSPNEVKVMNEENADCVRYVSFGKRKVEAIGSNHDAVAYLKHEAFNEALAAMLKS